jgi:hypothetical protein
MCGRFTNRLTWREIVALYRLSVPATPERNLPARYDYFIVTLAGAIAAGMFGGGGHGPDSTQLRLPCPRLEQAWRSFAGRVRFPPV